MSACPICKLSAGQIFDDSRRPSLLICVDCRHIYWDCTPGSSDLMSFYNSEYTVSHQQIDIQANNRYYYRDHVGEIANYINKGFSDIYLSDFGCSYPIFLEEAKKLGVGRLLGVELDRPSRDYGIARGISMLAPDEFFSQVPEGAIDIIRFSHVLEHLIDPVETLVAAVKKLAPGGLLYITQPSFPVFQSSKLGYPIKDSVYPNHLHFFSPISLERMLAQVPVNVVKFFTVSNADQMYDECAALLDLTYSEHHTVKWKSIGEPSRGGYSNYPFYCGENSALYAIKMVQEMPVQKSGFSRAWSRLFSRPTAGGIDRG